MHVLNFEGNEKDTIYKILAAVLHIGNIYFKRVHDSSHDTVLLGEVKSCDRYLSYH
jgi:myosin heavy subunit